MNREREKCRTGDNNTFLKESGMYLIVRDSFLIEGHLRSLKMEGVKTVEMLSFKYEKLNFIEAKSTFPNPNNKESSPKFEKAIQNIVDKFIHSLELYCSIVIGVRQAEVAAQPSKGVTFLLIIREHNKEWCRKIENGIKEKLPEYLKKIWKPEVYVLNYDMAIKKCFVVKDVPAGAKIIKL